MEQKQQDRGAVLPRQTGKSSLRINDALIHSGKEQGAFRAYERTESFLLTDYYHHYQQKTLSFQCRGIEKTISTLEETIDGSNKSKQQISLFLAWHDNKALHIPFNKNEFSGRWIDMLRTNHSTGKEPTTS